MEKEYIVGIDFGHGETSAWVVPLSLQTGSEQGETLRLKQSNKDVDRSYYSAIYCNSDGEYSLSDSEGNVITEFKKKISFLEQPDNDNKRKAYREYIRQIYQRLLKYNDTILKLDADGDCNFYICIACPTKWCQKDREDYIQFFNEALHDFGIQVMWVINESDAAFFSHGSIEKYANKCVLIIDYGSSTIDYTVFHHGLKISDDNWSNDHLGASNIEELILCKARNDSNYQEKANNTYRKLTELGMTHIDITSCCKFEIRKAKELSVREDKYPELNVNYNLIGEKTLYGKTEDFSAEKRDYKFEIECQIDTCIEEYKSKVVEDFKQLKDKIQKKNGNQGIDYVILSGGACQMPWVQEVVEDIFTPENIDLDTQASFVVSKGIALYARTQMKALNNFQSRIKGLDFSNLYIQADTNATTKSILKMMPPVINKLKSKPSLTGDYIRQEFCDFVENLNGNNIEYCNLVQQELDKLISNSVKDILKEVISSVFKVNIDTSDVKLHISADIIPWKHILFVPGGAFHDLFTNWIAKFSKALFGTLTFEWDKLRVGAELNKIIDGTAQSLENIIKSKQLIDYPIEAVNAYANDIKEQVLNIAVDIFYTKQLFKTTFRNN